MHFANQNMKKKKKNNLFSGWNNCVQSIAKCWRQAFNNNYAFGTHIFGNVDDDHSIHISIVDGRWSMAFQMLSRAIKHENTVFTNASRLRGRHISKCTLDFVHSQVNETHIDRSNEIKNALKIIGDWRTASVDFRMVQFKHNYYRNNIHTIRFIAIIHQCIMCIRPINGLFRTIKNHWKLLRTNKYI